LLFLSKPNNKQKEEGGISGMFHIEMTSQATSVSASSHFEIFSGNFCGQVGIFSTIMLFYGIKVFTTVPLKKSTIY